MKNLKTSLKLFILLILFSCNKEIEDKNDELKIQMEKINGFDKELDRHKVIIRRQEKQIETLNPDTEDVCLSARSFSEDMMISLRDEAIDAKEKQIGLLNQQNDIAGLVEQRRGILLLGCSLRPFLLEGLYRQVAMLIPDDPESRVPELYLTAIQN